MPTDVLDILPPIGGVDRRLGFQSQPPYTCADALNVWPKDVFASRMRTGSRPGLVKAFAERMGSPIHLLSNVRLAEGTAASGIVPYQDDFNSLGVQWSQASWKSDSVGAGGGYASVQSTGTAMPDAGMVLSDLQQDETVYYDISMAIARDEWFALDTTGPPSGIYSLFARMDNTTPDVTSDGLLVEADFSVSPVILRLTKYASGTATVYATQEVTTYNDLPILKLAVDTGDSYTASCGNASITQTITNANFGRRMGFGIKFRVASTRSSNLRVDWFRVNYTGASPSANRNVIVAIGGTNAGAGGVVDIKYEDTPGVLTAAGTNALTNGAAQQLIGAEMMGTIYIVGDDDETVWKFTGASAGTLANLTATDGGTVPTNGFALAVWRNRLCVVARSSSDFEQHNVSMSGVGDAEAWSEASIPVGSPIKLNTTGIDTGRLGEPINCLISHSDDYLLLGCLNSMYVLRGDPTYGGQIDRLSSTIGIAAPQAWARGPNGETVVLSGDGLYGIPPGIGGYPESISRERLPQELRDIDVNNYRVLMAFDIYNRGVFIGLTPMLGSGGSYFFFDWEGKGFWPMEFNSAHEPTALVYRNADSPLDTRLLLGCRDGYIRYFDNNAASDDGVNFESHLLIGPIALGGGGYHDGMLREIVGQLAVGSGNITCGVHVGQSIEQAYGATERSKFTLKAGKNLTHRPQLRGNAAFIRLSSNDGSAWALENMTVVRQKLGKQRLL